jgi:hypothetical protein
MIGPSELFRFLDYRVPCGMSIGYPVIMSDEYEHLPLDEADRRLREAIEKHRAAMAPLGRRRAELVAADVQRRGQRGVAEVAAVLGLSESAVRRLVSEAKRHAQERPSS